MAVLGYCKKCKKTHEIPVFFELNTENKISYCPRCGHQMTTKQANENYNKCLKDLYSEAEVLLFKAHDYEKAYRSYGKIIDAHPEDVVARYGRILSLIYLSTLRAPKFSDALVMFQSEKVKYLRLASYRKIYFAFLKQVNLALDNYHKKFMYRLMAADEYFYDVDCVSLYYDRILQIKNFKKVIKDECNYLSNKLLDESFEPLLNKIETEITLLDKELHGKKTTLEGVQYSFTKIGKDGRPIVSYGERRVLIKNQNKYPLYKLDKNAQNLPIIKDEIYKQKSWLCYYRNSSRFR